MSYIMFGRCAAVHHICVQRVKESCNRGHLYIYIWTEWYERERLQRPREGWPQIGHTFQFYLSHAVLGDVVVYIRVKKLWTLYINKTLYSGSIESLWRGCFESRPCSKQATGSRSTANPRAADVVVAHIHNVPIG